MTGKEILLQTLKGEQSERVPWVPFVGVHGGFLTDTPADDYLQSADAMAEAIIKSADLYKADGVPIAFDLQMEAEVLGCELKWAKDSPPSVVTHPLSMMGGKALADLPEFSTEKGRFPVALEALRKVKEAIGEKVVLYGLITGPLTLAMHLRGEELFLDIFDDADAVAELFSFAAEVGKKAAAAYLEAGADVVAVVDPMTSQISAEHFTGIVAKPLDAIFDEVREKGGLSSLFVCGNATRNLEVMAETRCDNISVDENVDLAKLRDVALAKGKSFGGNLKLTTVLLMGSPMDVRRETMRCLDTGGEKGFVLAPGCDLPYSTPVENLQTVAELAQDPYQQDVARQLPTEEKDDDFSDITIPDYKAEPEVIVDVVTLDSASCAPCTYMVRAAVEGAKAAGIPAQVREHKITGRQGLGYMAKLGVDAIPTICIAGKPTFASIIPDRQAIAKAIKDAAEGRS